VDGGGLPRFGLPLSVTPGQRANAAPAALPAQEERSR